MDALPPASVAADVTMRLLLAGGGLVLVDAHLRYDTTDPYAVSVGFEAGSDSLVEWTFGRELLLDGLHDMTGDGDVRVWPSLAESTWRERPTVCLSLTAPSGAALFEVDRETLTDFLDQAAALVPVGRECEFIDIDGALAVLLIDAHLAD
jgi:hypothetical protein